jgi:hypothetical protein
MAEGQLVPVLLTKEQMLRLVTPIQESIELRDGRTPVPPSERPSGRGRTQTKEGESVKDPEFEKKHPRGEAGKFAEKEETAGGIATDDRDKLDQEPWPRAQSWTAENGEQFGIKGIVVLDDIEYTVLHGISKEELLAVHEVNKRVYARLSEVYGKDPVKIDLVLMPKDKEQSMMAFATQNPLKGIREGAVYIDNGLVANEDYLESVIVHETLHCQPRLSSDYTNPDYYRGEMRVEEIMTGLVELDYAERYGLTPLIGWTMEISTAVKAAQELDWDKAILYRFAGLVHKVDGPQYRIAMDGLLRMANVEKKYYPEALDAWYKDWRKPWDDIAEIYDDKWAAKPLEDDYLWKEWDYRWSSLESELAAYRQKVMYGETP